MAASMAAESAAALDVPKELPLRVVGESGRVITAQLDVDMQGGTSVPWHLPAAMRFLAAGAAAASRLRRHF